MNKCFIGYTFDQKESLLNSVSTVLESIQKADGDGIKINRIEKNLTRYLIKVWNDRSTKAINKALSFTLSGNQEKIFTKSDQNKVISILDSEYNGIDKEVKSRVGKDITEIYKINKTAIARKFELRPKEKSLIFKTKRFDTLKKSFIDYNYKVKSVIRKEDFSITARFNAVDQGIADNITRLEVLAIGDHFPMSLKPQVSKIIKEGVVDKGLNKAQAGEFLKTELTRKLGGSVSGVPPRIAAQGQASVNAYYKGLSATNVTTTQTFSQIQLFDEAGIQRFIYRAIIDNRTSEICLMMDGRVFTVEIGKRHMEAYLGAESVDELKKISPFTRNLNAFGLKAGEKLTDQSTMELLASNGIVGPPMHFRCYHRDTEVYTERGFIKMSEVNIGEKCLSLNPETKNLDWVPVVETQKIFHDGFLYNFTNNQNSLNMSVTPDHTMFYYKRVDGKGGRRDLPFFSDVEKFMSHGSEGKFYVSSEWDGLRIKTITINGLTLKMEDYCKFIGYYLSDGSTRFMKNRNGGGSYTVQIAQIDNNEKMYNELSKMGFKSVTRTKDKVHIYDSRIGKYCKKFGYSYQKFVPAIIKEASPKIIRVFLDAFNMCDGMKTKPSTFKDGEFGPMNVYFTTSKRMADDIGELLIKVGKSCSYTLEETAGKMHKFKNGVYKINHNCWRIYEISSKFRYPKIIKKEKYKDFVYDLTLEENHTLLIRYKNRVAWGSNCRSSLEPE